MRTILLRLLKRRKGLERKRKLKAVNLESGVYNVKETADFLRISTNTLYDIINKGELGGVFSISSRCTLITASGINAFICNKINY